MKSRGPSFNQSKMHLVTTPTSQKEKAESLAKIKQPYVNCSADLFNFKENDSAERNAEDLMRE